MRYIALLLASAAACGAQQAAFEGTAVNAMSREPLRGVHVRLVAVQEAATIYGAMSDARGRFSMAAVAPGTYALTPECRGFVYTGKPDVALKAGQRLTDFRLEMAPRAIIAGRVLDEYGDPVERVWVQAVPVDPKPDFAKGNMTGVTDDRGEYRMSGAPGKYQIKASGSERMMAGNTPVLRAGGAMETAYGTTWYPSAASVERATVVEAGPGITIGGLDIRLVQRQSLTLSGTVRGIPEGSMANVTLQTGSGPRWLEMSMGMSVGPDGAFSFNRLAPGFHRLFAQVRSGGDQLQSGVMDMNLESNVSGVELVLAAGGDLVGKLEMPGGAAGGRKVRLVRLDGLGMPEPAAVDVDREGAFQLRSVAPGRFRVVVDPLPEDAYMAAVSVDGKEAGGEIVDLSQGAHGSKLSIKIGLDGARVTGKVLNAEGEPLDGMAVVYLTADPKDIQPREMVRSSDGTYGFQALRPGRYRIFAVSAFQRAGVGSVEAMRELAARAPEIEVKKGDRITRDLKIDAEKH